MDLERIPDSATVKLLVIIIPHSTTYTVLDQPAVPFNIH
jgi:hypothetical protein